VNKTIVSRSSTSKSVEMESSDLVDECMARDDACSQRYDECYNFYNKGMIYAAHQLMLKNIDNALDLGGRQSRLYEAIKRDHTLVFSTSAVMKAAEKWTESVVSNKCRGVDDSIKNFASKSSAIDHLIEGQIDAGSFPLITLASRLEFADAWIGAISESKFVRQLSGNSHVVCLTVTNPVLSYLGGKVVYVRIDTFDNTLFDQTYIVILTPLTTAQCRKLKIGDARYVANSRFFAFSAVTFLFSSVSFPALESANTNVKIYVENMQVVRYAPIYLNNLACVDLFAKMCKIWANTARQVGDMLYEGERLEKIVSFMEKSSRFQQ